MSKLKKIVVTGANGQLGKCLQDVADLYPDLEWHFFDREKLPLDQFEKVTQILTALSPDIIINAAAYTAVDKAEKEQEAAFLINGDAVGHLAGISGQIGAKFLHVSTDYVFDGNGKIPYKETDAVSPVNTYGASKLDGEVKALESDPSCIIVRTSWVYSKHGNNFVKTMLRLMKERESIGVVSDQTGCPTFAPDLAEALIVMATADNATGGIYHFSNSGPITWHDFASTIATFSGSTCIVNAIPSSAFPTPAKRPVYSVMDNTKICETFAIKQKDWKESLKVCLHQLQP
jgi:dTDP-4-dehydrorhamnose reductase